MSEGLREIVLDTETTGMDPLDGHRLVEIGCIELAGHLPTGRHFHCYINPERDVPIEAAAVHGLTTERLAAEKTFGEIVADFLDFIGTDAKLVIHNAEFDMKFLNYELKKFGFPSIDHRRVVDTLAMARLKFPGSPANLDALCRRFDIGLEERTLHGALLDSRLLADVYLELLGGRQHGLDMAVESAGSGDTAAAPVSRPRREARSFPPSEEELAAHAALLDKLSDPLWRKGGLAV